MRTSSVRRHVTLLLSLVQRCAVLLIALGWVAPATCQAQDKPDKPLPGGLKASLSVYVVAQAMDLSTTTHLLAQGGVEKNALLRSSMKDPAAAALVKTGMTAFTTWGTIRLAKQGHRKLATWLAVGMASGTALVAIHNYRELKR